MPWGSELGDDSEVVWGLQGVQTANHVSRVAMVGRQRRTRALDSQVLTCGESGGEVRQYPLSTLRMGGGVVARGVTVGAGMGNEIGQGWVNPR
jgi:hypothetical protein